MQSQQILDRAQKLLSEGRAAASGRNWIEAEVKLTEAMHLGGQLDPRQTDLPVMAMLALAQLSYDRGQAEQAVDRATSAFALSTDAAPDGEWQLPLYELMANLYEEMGAPQRSVAFRHALVNIWRSNENGSEHARRNCLRLAASLRRLGLYEQAAAAYQQAGAMECALEWAESLSLAGRHQDALRIVERAPATGATLAAIARMMLAAGQPARAIEYFTKAGAVETGPIAGWAAACLAAGDLTRARQLAEQAVRHWRAETSDELAGALETLARVMETLGDLPAAEAHCREAIGCMDRRRIPDLTARERRLRLHAELLRRLDRPSDAARALQQAAQTAAIRSQVPKLFPSDAA
jgi:tetratricopeptide (TPR) repeat protein